MKTFCPTCEEETECTLSCEVYECSQCNDDFGDYDMPRISKLEDENERLRTALREIANVDGFNNADLRYACSIAIRALLPIKPASEKDAKIAELNSELELVKIELQFMNEDRGKLKFDMEVLKRDRGWVHSEDEKPRGSDIYEIARWSMTNHEYVLSHNFYSAKRNAWDGFYGDGFFWRESFPIPLRGHF